ncbi:MAG: DUF1788 domain-containing protein [Desulfobacterales bacterium]|nr:DUF1788 domain-containing protein [Desulfobacterales bacterium]
MNVKERVEELKRDLLNENGPQISAMGSFPFAIFQYDPGEEFRMRELIHELVSELRREGWRVKNISLIDLMLKRLERDEDDVIRETIAVEKRLFRKKRNGLNKALSFLKSVMIPDLQDENGLAADVIAEIRRLKEETDDGRTLVFISRAGALHPFYKTSGLLRYLDGRTLDTPVILLYPGSRPSRTALSFMDEYPPDPDYRPRIY